MKLNFKFLRKYRLLKQRKEFWIEIGKSIATSEYNKDLKIISSEHLRTIKKINKTHVSQLKDILSQASALESQAEKKLEYLKQKESEILELHDTINLYDSEGSRYYNNLRDKYSDERKKKMIGIEYDKSSLDHLSAKSEIIKNKTKKIMSTLQ